MKVLSKHYEKPRTYLLYKGAWRPQGRDNLFGGALILQQPFEHGMAPYLVHDNNLGREYELEKEILRIMKPKRSCRNLIIG